MSFDLSPFSNNVYYTPHWITFFLFFVPENLETSYYNDQLVGEYAADILVEDKVILELKSVKDLHPAHSAQLINYLKATGIEIGLLINFGESVQIKRKILSQAQ